MKIKAVLFDLDGTLLDTAPDFVICVNNVRARCNLPPLEASTIRAQVSNGARALTRLASGLDDNDPALGPLYIDLLAHYRAILGQHSTLFPGIAETLSWLEQQNLPWGIVTNKPSAYTLPLLDYLALPFTPSAVVCPDHVTRSKPDPEPLLLACTQIGCAPELTVYVGDHRRDIEAGRNAAMPTISCAYGYVDANEDIDSWGADYRADHASKLISIIENII